MENKPTVHSGFSREIPSMNNYFRHMAANFRATPHASRRVILLMRVMLALVMVATLIPRPSAALAQTPSTTYDASDFELAVAPGFGDRNNSFPWAMQWWNGY